jgi:hypothetical protein
MRERGLLKMGFSGAFPWSASENFWVGTFLTGTTGSFQPELTLRRAGAGFRRRPLLVPPC